MRRRRGRRLCLGVGCALLVLIVAGAGSLPAARAAAAGTPVVTISTDQLSTAAPFMGLGVQWDPYDSFTPTADQWNLIVQRLDAMHPGFFRVVEPASDYFRGYDAAHNPVYRWSASHVMQLRKILDYAQSRGIPVVLGDWSNPLIHGDPRIPALFLQQLHDVYGYTTIRYYNLINEPNDVGATCDFVCWTGIVRTLSTQLAALGLNKWLTLVGPDNANSWDDTAVAQAIDRTSGLDVDNPIGGDSWVTATLHSIPSLIGTYDSHRYATIWGIEHGVYADQMRARREQISNVDSPLKSYFAGEVGMTARLRTPFSALRDLRDAARLSGLIDPSVRPNASAFVDSQPHIAEFGYGVWMGDMMVQGISAGMSGASAWDLDDAMHVGGQYGAKNLKQWGFWNSLGGQDGYPASDLEARPWYYSWSVLARSFPAGSEPLATPATGIPGVRIAAARIPNGGRDELSFAIVNDSDAPRSLTLSAPAARDPLTLARYDYFAAERTVDANGFPVPAAILHGVVLAGGVTVQLPSRGLVVLSSFGIGTPVALSNGRNTVVDPLVDWRRITARTKGLTLDHSVALQFNEDGSRAAVAAKAKGTQALVYRAGQMTSFELKAYSRKTLGLRVFRSPDGKAWTPVAVASTTPAPAIGGHMVLADVLPGEPIPAGTNRLKVELGKGTELGQVTIAAGRAGPACLARTIQATAESLAGVGLGSSERGVRGRYGAPSGRTGAVWRYCVVGGGNVVVVFTAHGKVSLIASTAAGYRPHGVGPGSSVGLLRRRFGTATLRWVAGNVVIASTAQGQLLFVTRAARVQAVALATPSLLKSRRSLLRAVRMAGLDKRAAAP